MPHVIRYKATGEYVNDFQSSANGLHLIYNAVSAGLGEENDFEIVDVTLQQFYDIIEQYKAAHPSPPKEYPKIKINVQVQSPSSVLITLSKGSVVILEEPMTKVDAVNFSKEFEETLLG